MNQLKVERLGSFILFSRSQSAEQQSMDCSLAQRWHAQIVRCSQVRLDSLSRISRISYRGLPLPKLRQPLPLMNNVSIDFTLSLRRPSCGKLLPKRMSSTGGVHRDSDGHAGQPELMVPASRRWDRQEAQLSVPISFKTVHVF